MKKINKYLSLVVAPLAFTPIISITNCGAQSSDFETDSWEHVISVTNSGFISFAKTYVENKNYESEDEAIQTINDWIVDKAHHNKKISRRVILTFNDIEIESQVYLIGINHDILADDSGKAKLTFDFNDVLSYCMLDPTDTNPNWRYYNYESKACQWTYNVIFPALPKILRDNIKTIKKKTVDFAKTVYDPTTDTMTVEYIYQDEKLCPLTPTEIDFPLVGRRSGTAPGEGIYTPAGEGEKYVWFDQLADRRQMEKHFVGGSIETATWWLRTPYFKAFSPYGRIKDIGSFFLYLQMVGPSAVHDAVGISPMFCI